MCLNFVKSQQWIDGIIIGVNNIAQLNENIMLFENKSFYTSKRKYKVF